MMMMILIILIMMKLMMMMTPGRVQRDRGHRGQEEGRGRGVRAGGGQGVRGLRQEEGGQADCDDHRVRRDQVRRQAPDQEAAQELLETGVEFQDIST